MASTHIALGMGCWMGYAKLRGLPVEPIPYALAAIGSLLPDIDHPKSAFGKTVPFFSIPISMIFGHRGITHSLLAVVALAVAIFFYGKSPYIAPIIIGYLSHLFGDMLTNSGVPLLWPKKDKVSIPLFNTGGLLEGVFRFAIAAFILFDTWNSLKPMLHLA